MDELLVQTPCGTVRGVPGDGVGTAVFKGIRYATAGRWEYPAEVTHWDGTYDASRFGSCSWQPRAFYDEAELPEKAFYYHEFREGDRFAYGDDCLFLNVWAPTDAKDAPVLFYIHGGGFKGGCGHEKHFDGGAYCARGVILVTINYRLGPMGFLALPELRDEAGHTGNYALFDQLAALQWVRHNIAAFGGDPERITIMGQSAGAMSVQQLCVSPLTDGLFQGAVMMSGGGVSKLMGDPKPVEDAYAFWREVMEAAGAKNLAALRALDAERLFSAFQEKTKGRQDTMTLCSPMLDGAFLTESAADAAKAGRQKAIPYLMGSTSEDIVPPIVHKMAKGWARLQADQSKRKSFCYFFCRQLPGDDCGAWHSADLWYTFGTLGRSWRPFTDWDRELSGLMVDYLARFVRTGDPNGPGSPQWLPAEKGQSGVLRLGDREVRMGGVSIPKLVKTMLTKPAVGE